MGQAMITILLVDDNAAFRASMRTWLESEPDLTVVGESGDGVTAVRLVAERRPDVVVMDVVMPKQNGIETTLQIVALHPAVRVLALSMHAEDRFVAAMQNAGALGYVLKDQAFEELVSAIRAVGMGQTHFRIGV